MDWEALKKAKEFFRKEPDTKLLLELHTDYAIEREMCRREGIRDRFEQAEINMFAVRYVIEERLDSVKN